MHKIEINLPSECKIIGEIGINHNGDVEIAKKLIDMAKRAGCDAVKFQKRTIDIVYSEDFLKEKRESPWGNTQRAQKEGLEFNIKEYELIDQYCKDSEIEWFASAWDIPSLTFLDQFKPKNQKIASAMITNLEFLEAAASRKVHTFISTGMSDYKMIDKAVEIFNKAKCDFTLMHSVSTYPCPIDKLHLKNIPILQKRYNCKVVDGQNFYRCPFCHISWSCCMRSIYSHRTMYGSDKPLL